jgi:hypothetical protein
MTPRLLTTLFLTALWASPLRAGEPGGAGCAPRGLRLWPHCWTQTSVCPSLGGTLDDYCRKNICIADIPRCGGPDDYCRKNICITDIPRCGGPDDYCRKSIPCLLCPPFSPHLRYLNNPCCAARP